MNAAELDLVASVLHTIRPSWRHDSLRTFLAQHVKDKPYRDVLIAGVWVALDPAATTPNLLVKDGVWWQISRLDQGTPTPPVGMCPYHPGEPEPCPECAAYARTVLLDTSRIRAIRNQHRPADTDRYTPTEDADATA